MRYYMVCYRFMGKGRWYGFKTCKKEDLQTTIEDAFLVNGVVEVKINPLPDHQ